MSLSVTGAIAVPSPCWFFPPNSIASLVFGMFGGPVGDMLLLLIVVCHFMVALGPRRRFFGKTLPRNLSATIVSCFPSLSLCTRTLLSINLDHVIKTGDEKYNCEKLID